MQVCKLILAFVEEEQLLSWKDLDIYVSTSQSIMLRFMPIQKLFHGFISSIFHQKSEQKPPSSWENYNSNEETALN